MKCFVGVDLGSTTTKAVVLDEQERLLGRGITNSRSNYDVACAVARSEAFVNARFGLFARKLSEAGLAEKDSLDLTSGLERHFRRVQYAIQQEALAETMRAETLREKYEGMRDELNERLETILQAMQDDIPAFFAEGAA